MEKLRRLHGYAEDYDEFGVEEKEDGDLVYYDDAMAALARKDAMLRELADAALRAVNCEDGCGGCFRTCIFDRANTVRDLADAARKEAGT